MRRVLRAQMAGVPRANAAEEIHGAPGTRGTIVDVMTRVSADLVCSALKRLRGYGAPRSSQRGTIHVAASIASIVCNEIRLCLSSPFSSFPPPPPCASFIHYHHQCVYVFFLINALNSYPV